MHYYGNARINSFFCLQKLDCYIFNGCLNLANENRNEYILKNKWCFNKETPSTYPIIYHIHVLIHTFICFWYIYLFLIYTFICFYISAVRVCRCSRSRPLSTWRRSWGTFVMPGQRSTSSSNNNSSSRGCPRDFPHPRSPRQRPPPPSHPHQWSTVSSPTTS